MRSSVYITTICGIRTIISEIIASNLRKDDMTSDSAHGLLSSRSMCAIVKALPQFEVISKFGALFDQ